MRVEDSQKNLYTITVILDVCGTIELIKTEVMGSRLVTTYKGHRVNLLRWLLLTIHRRAATRFSSL